MFEGPAFIAVIAVTAIILLSIFFHFVPFFLWLSAKVSGVQISLLQLFLMRIRNVPPGVIVPSLIEAHKAGLGTITRDNLEAHYMTGGHVTRGHASVWLKAKHRLSLRRRQRLTWQVVMFEAVQTSVNRKSSTRRP